MTNILISGASIAGTATAYWLRRHGYTVTVVERAPAIRTGGYKVDVRGAALEVIERMGLLDAVRARGTDMRVATYYDAAGRPLAAMDADLFGGRTGDDAEIMRGDLNELLYDLTRDEVEYVFGDSITGIAEDGAVTFERSLPRTFDLVVGADGVHSNVRRLAFGDESACTRDLGHYISICTVPNTLGLDREEAVHAAVGRTANVYSTRQDTAAKALFMWSSPPLDHDHRDVDGQKKLLARAMEGVGWQVPALLEAARDAEDFYFDTVAQIHLDRWSKGRVVLVGDAGYCASPASGQGTSLALVGAYVLAGELATGGGTEGYERELRPFVAANQALGPANVKGMVIGSRAALWFQLRMMRLLPRLPGRNRMIERITGPIFRAANAVTLKDYAR
ncbi:2-polyprenyl-6-methoxyphenol hydroxylase-like FAD-dependent oxidoreductase [Nonomuraea thailandensis]|uniref:2-polyprenyl-6-methoxyphenol hydroxylase-like FAD-dependent oxidoreductase n=1 Tax=Nonomuraea thailandensis TaxID=1188745 RepID=A0A9X2GY74_9ACTN|nr:FAD-dependent monooxygenase [Nonomuraea thailandensis]MCP2362518.1 2-polyprenyl-6-methoxyphenol hydroxylase-like FAD-dependent oxidoreductase [Nonomuraea thailandensis]